MARRRRSDEQHGYFHVWNRGVDRQDIFFDDADRDVFVDLTAEAADRNGVEVHAFCLMSNHFHQIVSCPDGGLSEFLQQVQRRYVAHHNPRVERVGHLFTGRFGSTLISDEQSRSDGSSVFSVMARYVHRNALDRLGVDQLASDPYSSYGVYVGERVIPDWLRTDVLLGLHGDDPQRIRAFTEASHPADRTPVAGFAIEPYSVDEVLAAVAATLGVDRHVLVTPSAGRPNRERAFAAHLCAKLRCAPPDDLARRFGTTLRSFRRLATRGKDRCGAEPGWAARAHLVIDVLESGTSVSERMGPTR